MRTLTLIILIVTQYISFAQNAERTVDIGTSDISNIAIIADSNKNLCLYYQTLKTDNFKIINPNGDVTKTFSLSNKDYEYGDKLPLHGIVTTDSAYIFYFGSLKGKLYLNTYYISKSGNSNKKITDINLKLNKGDKLIDAFSNRKSLFVIVQNKKLNKINILEFTSASTYKVHTFDSSRQLDEFFADPNFAVIKKSTPITIENAAKNRKLYITEPDKLILTWDKHEFDTDEPNVDDEPDTDTKFWVFDLKTDKVEKRIFPKTKCHNNNTFYYHDKLYRLSLLSDYMKLEIFNVSSQKSIYKYEYTKNDSITLINDRVTQTGKNTNFFINEGDRELKDPQKILKRLSKGTPAVAVQNELGDTLSLLIGAYQQIDQPVQTVISPTAVGAGVSAPAITMTDPAAMSASASPGSIPGGSYNTWFSTAIKQSDYSIINNFSEVPIFKRTLLLSNTLKESNIKFDRSFSFKINNRNYFGYLLRKTTLVKIVEIP